MERDTNHHDNMIIQPVIWFESVYLSFLADGTRVAPVDKAEISNAGALKEFKLCR
jgi:hypothetical protein